MEISRDSTIVFEILGDYGYFKRFYTTSSPLTFDFPPKTALTGMIGAIIGLSYEQRYELFNTKIALEVLHAKKKRMFGTNWLNTKWRGKDPSESMKKWLEYLNLKPSKDIYPFLGLEWKGHSPHTQANLEILLEPCYRIYYSCENIYARELHSMLKDHKRYYPLYLGNSEFIGDYKFIGIYPQEKIENSRLEFIKINSIIPSTVFNNNDTTDVYKINSYQKLIITNTPYIMVENRKTIEYINIIYDLEGRPIEMKVPSYFKVKMEKDERNIVYF
ncbi:MAG: type I-B CRISPR-associated protein Cas5b [Candidatus Helarchaeota archaeon]